MIRALRKNYKNLFYASVSRHLVDSMKYLHLPHENIYKSLKQGQGCIIHFLFVCSFEVLTVKLVHLKSDTSKMS